MKSSGIAYIDSEVIKSALRVFFHDIESRFIIIKSRKYVRFFFLIVLLPLLISCEPDAVVVPDQNSRDAFIGIWICTDKPVKSTHATYEVRITADPVFDNRIVLENFFHLGSDAKPYGIVEGSSLIVPQQLTCADKSWTVSGQALLISKSEIRWNEYNANELVYTATFKKL